MDSDGYAEVMEKNMYLDLYCNRFIEWILLLGGVWRDMRKWWGNGVVEVFFFCPDLLTRAWRICQGAFFWETIS